MSAHSPDMLERVARLVGEYPLAWVVSRQFNASPLPLLAECNRQREIISLFGHCARHNPLCEDFAQDASGLVLFNGPEGYVSPRHVGETDWGPTWNYAVLRFRVEIEFQPEETGASVERLLGHLEGRTEARWTTAELGARYERMLDRIIAFRAHVRDCTPAFKLGQDEKKDVFAQIVTNHPDRQLAQWMREMVEGTA
ncbi:FMN-binding negative transcriptional regulator [Alteriqipengyuania lutimaris]|uniref:FMN-binding negative transcriptional regulator n=1 Tax=Alteriqipengyuania lutimaris TaxID=1538146 RepID=A0A395LNG1_9SPHN|nr:FMN-binding negative transcriptional regulator [Alteriqipengyuania lutimaris]MBB3032422.1 transcriptional regulator [Alteriqipengyuania lutimaris]RDS78432.1 FMN-binding negative transcriptional regulator [Alteriqipengyuania lutimaris]